MIEKMISSFDGTQLYMKSETAADNKAIVVIVHGLCEHQGRYDYFVEKLHAAGYGTAVPRVICPTTALSTKFWMIPM